MKNFPKAPRKLLVKMQIIIAKLIINKYLFLYFYVKIPLKAHYGLFSFVIRPANTDFLLRTTWKNCAKGQVFYIEFSHIKNLV